MINAITTVGKVLKALLAPDFCFYCRDYLWDTNRLNNSYASRDFICASCVLFIKPVISKVLSFPNGQTSHIYAVSAYEDPLLPLVLAKEWSDYTASKQLARLMYDFSILKKSSYDYIVPVPAHWTRIADRGYNQTAVMAQELGRLMALPVINALDRIKRTPQQRGSSAVKRRQNVKDAFLLTDAASKVVGCRVLLIDDVMTTGATVFECTEELFQTKPCEIATLVACRVV